MDVVLPVREELRGMLDMRYTEEWFGRVYKLRLWISWEMAEADMEAAVDWVEESEEKIRRRNRRWCRWRVAVKWRKFEDALAEHDELVRNQARDATRRRMFLRITDCADTTEEE